MAPDELELLARAERIAVDTLQWLITRITSESEPPDGREQLRRITEHYYQIRLGHLAESRRP